MIKNNSSMTNHLETALNQINKVSFIKLIMFIIPVSMFSTFVYLLSSDVFTFIMYTFFE